MLLYKYIFRGIDVKNYENRKMAKYLHRTSVVEKFR